MRKRHPSLTVAPAVALGALVLGASACGSSATVGLARVAVAQAHPPFSGWWNSVTPAGVSIVVSSDVLFALDSATLSEAGRGALAPIAAQLASFPGAVAVIGFTDNSGPAAYNVALSRRRAAAVAEALESMGVASGRITTIGRGSADPRATNLTPDGRAHNRRVEINYMAASSTKGATATGASQ